MRALSITFIDARVDFRTIGISVTDGRFELARERPLAISCRPGPVGISAAPGLIKLTLEEKIRFSADIDVQLALSRSGAPGIRVDGFEGFATIHWPVPYNATSSTNLESGETVVLQDFAP